MEIKLADTLVSLRKKNGLSQEQLAEKLNISRQAISKWERAESSPDTENLIKLASLYNISLNDLVNRHEQKENTMITHELHERDYKRPINTFLLIGGFIICIGLAVWKPMWISFIFIPLCYLIYAIVSNNKGGE